MKSNKPDPPPNKEELCHTDMITCILVLTPEDYVDSYRGHGASSSHENTDSGLGGSGRGGVTGSKKAIKFITSSRDGTVKIWSGLHLKWEATI